MSAPIFVSHSSKDRKVAGTICSALEARGHKCWVASRDVRPGENFMEAIVRTIRSAKVMVLIFTENANNSEEIKKEIVLATQHKLAIIPLRVEDVLPNDALAYQFATMQWIDLFDDWEQAITRLSSTSVFCTRRRPASKLRRSRLPRRRFHFRNPSKAPISGPAFVSCPSGQPCVMPIVLR